MANGEKSVVSVIERTKLLMKEEDELRRRKRLVGVGFPALIILIFVVFYLLFSGAIKSFDQDAFFARLETNVMRVYPDLGLEVKRVAGVLLPFYMEEINKASGEAATELEDRFAAEMEKLQKSVQDKIAAESAMTLLKLSEEQRKILLAELPELAKDPKATDQLLVVLNNATIGWVQSVFSRALEGHAMAFLDLKKTLDRGYKLDEQGKAAMDNEQMLTLLLEFMDESLTGDATIIKSEKK